MWAQRDSAPPEITATSASGRPDLAMSANSERVFTLALQMPATLQ